MYRLPIQIQCSFQCIRWDQLFDSWLIPTMYRLAHSEEFGRPPPRAIEPQRAGDVDVFPWTGNGGGVLKSAAAPTDLNQVANLANGQRRFGLRCRRWGSGRRKRSWRWQSAADGNGVSAAVAVGGGDSHYNGVVPFGQVDLMAGRVGVGVVGEMETRAVGSLGVAVTVVEAVVWLTEAEY